MSSISGNSAWPLSVRAYSTRGGTSGKVWRSTIPSSSSARRRSDRVRGLIPASERSSSQKRERPSARSRTSKSVHLPHTTSAVRQTGHVSSMAIRPFTLPSKVLLDRAQRRNGRRRRRIVPLGLRRGDIVHRGPAPPVGLHQELEVVRTGCHAHGIVERDEPSLDVTEERLVEGLHSVLGAGGARLVRFPG